MIKCNSCSRKFKSEQALAAHISHAHSQKKTDIDSASSEQAGETKAAATVDKEPSEAEQIRSYAKQGLTFEELTTKLSFKPSTVRQELAKIIVEQKTATEKSGEKSQALPVVIKDGKGEMIAPEAVYQQLVANDGIGGEMEYRALMKWLVAIEMVQRITQIKKDEVGTLAEAVKPMLDMMERSRQELDAAAARAKESNMAIAEAAAMGAAGGVLGRIDARFEELKRQKADIATVEKPMQGLMARTMELMMNRLTGMVFGGGGQVPPTPGLVDKRIPLQGG